MKDIVFMTSSHDKLL